MNENVLELTDESYTDFIANCNGVLFLDFYSDTCPPCQTLLKFLPRLAEHFKDENVVIAKVNAAYNPKLSSKFMVKSIPLTLVIGEDKMVKRAEVGLLGIEKYNSMIESALGKKKGLFAKIFG